MECTLALFPLVGILRDLLYFNGIFPLENVSQTTVFRLIILFHHRLQINLNEAPGAIRIDKHRS